MGLRRSLLPPSFSVPKCEVHRTGLHGLRVRTGISSGQRGGLGGQPHPPHLYPRAGRPPPGPEGWRASRGRRAAGQDTAPRTRPAPWAAAPSAQASGGGGVSVDQPGQGPAGRPLEGTGWGCRVRAALSTQRPAGTSFPSSARGLSGGEGTAQLTRAAGRRPSSWNFPGTHMGPWSGGGCGREPARGAHSPPGSSWVSCPPGRSSVVTEERLSAGCREAELPREWAGVGRGPPLPLTTPRATCQGAEEGLGPARATRGQCRAGQA